MVKKLLILFAIVALWTAGTEAAPNFRIPGYPELESDAERLKDDLSNFWFGRTYPDYSQPLTIKITIRQGNGGSTSFANGIPFHCHCYGSYDGVRGSVLPHEVNHMVLHAHLGDHIPRWLDEGLCTLIEQDSEKVKLIQYMNQKSQRFSPQQLKAATEYPQEVGLFYAQSYLSAAYCCHKYGNRGVITRWVQKKPILFTNEEVEAWHRSGAPEAPAANGQYYFDSTTGKWAQCQPGVNCPPRTILPRRQPQSLPTAPTPTPTPQAPGPGASTLQADIEQLKRDRDTGRQQLANINQVVQQNSQALQNNSAQVQILQADLQILNQTTTENNSLLGKILNGEKPIRNAIKEKVVDDSLSQVIIWVAGILGLSTTGTTGLIVGYKLIRFWMSRRRRREYSPDPTTPKIGGATGTLSGDSRVVREAMFPEIPRDNEEAIQLLQLGRQEGRDPVHDAFVGMSVEDELREIAESGSDAEKSWAQALITRLRAKFNRIVPFPGGNR